MQQQKAEAKTRKVLKEQKGTANVGIVVSGGAHDANAHISMIRPKEKGHWQH